MVPLWFVIFRESIWSLPLGYDCKCPWWSGFVSDVNFNAQTPISTTLLSSIVGSVPFAEILFQSLLLFSGSVTSKKFTEFMYERISVLSMTASIQDVCKKHLLSCFFWYGFLKTIFSLLCPVHAVLLACIESQDPVIRSPGPQNLVHLFEADVTGNLIVLYN